MQLSFLLSLSRELLDRSHNLKKSDIETLREVIKEHNRLYHIEEQPIISDTEYDILFHALARAEVDYDMLDDASPTAKLAILASEQFQKVKHIYPMISLDNTYNVEEVRDFEKRMKNILKEKSPKLFPYYIQPKYDGLGLAVIYKFGKLNQAITRGSGVEGEDVTLTAFEIGNLPKIIPSLQSVERMEIRGEVMMSRTEFNRVNHERSEQSEKLFANPRNCASGSLRQLDPLVTRSRKLQFFAYSIPQIEQGIDGSFEINTYEQMMTLLSSWGFEREDFPFTCALGIDDLASILDRETIHRKEYFDFDIDGMVLKLDDMTLWDELGRTEHHPRYAIAYKFPAKQVRTRVLSIEHSVGRTGTITPVANLDPVEVTGVIVRRATLHNYDELEKKGVREGDYVFIMRAGEVIPEVVSVLTELRNGSEKVIEIPKTCPICSTQTQQDEGMVAIYCPNPHCPAKIQGQLEMFVGKQGLNIDGLGVKQIELFLELGWITDFVSIFHLAKYREHFFEIEGYKEKSINNLLDSIEKSRHTSLDRVFVALGIPQVGKKTGKILAEYIFSLRGEGESLISTFRKVTYEGLEALYDIGPETAESVVVFIEENDILIERLLHELDIIIPEKIEKKGGVLVGKAFCVTGSFEAISRDDIHELIEKNGGEVRTSVTSKLDYLIVGENAGSKKTKAQSLGVECVSLQDFLTMLA
ncbi:MAG: NAD-dependent DNA ligase LigA [Candidatus Altimarinota bacterium]